MSKIEFDIDTTHGHVRLVAEYPEDQGRAVIGAIQAVGDRIPSLVSQLHRAGDPSIAEFLTERGFSIDEPDDELYGEGPYEEDEDDQ